ncbi:DUF5320 family protein [Candidatus Bathyarchaeota archaeon]|nr:DUF5320 family protein [Candidatus Bathyarchaeota archaeon]
MPRGDRTGPWGSGPMTGRAAGYCAGYPVPGFMNPAPGYGRGQGFRRGWGRGRGRGFGRGYGRGWRAYPPQNQQPYPPLAYPLAQPPYQYAYPPRYPPVTQSRTPEQEIQALEDWKKELEAERADLEEEMGKIASRMEELKATVEQGKK